MTDPTCPTSEDRLGKVTNFVDVPEKGLCLEHQHSKSEEEKKADEDLEAALRGL